MGVYEKGTNGIVGWIRSYQFQWGVTILGLLVDKFFNFVFDKVHDNLDTGIIMITSTVHGSPSIMFGMLVERFLSSALDKIRHKLEVRIITITRQLQGCHSILDLLID